MWVVGHGGGCVADEFRCLFGVLVVVWSQDGGVGCVGLRDCQSRIVWPRDRDLGIGVAFVCWRWGSRSQGWSMLHCVMKAHQQTLKP